MTPDSDVMRIAGFDMGRQYIAWATLVSVNDAWELERHGILYPPDMGTTAMFGNNLGLFRSFFQHFVQHDLEVGVYAAERFIKMMGNAGNASEDVNLLLGQMQGTSSHFVRNVDWKTWFKKKVHAEGAPAFFCLPTDHEGDAAGIGMYLGSVIMPRLIKLNQQRMHV